MTAPPHAKAPAGAVPPVGSLLVSATVFASPSDVHAHIGREICVTDWVAVTQQRIDRFAEATGDHQWIHVDRERAARESPYGTTIAHGFLTLSMMGLFYEDYLARALPFCDMGLNYGLNRVRFTHPVRVDERVRSRLRLDRVEELPHGLQLTFGVTIDIDGQPRPACVAESVIRRHYRGGAAPA